MGNAPVVFSVGPGGGQLQLASETSPKTTLAVLTDATGRAKVYFQAPNTPNTPCTVSAGTPAGSHPVQAAFAEASNGNTGPANPSPSDDPDNPVEPQTVPTQSYACLDVSGDSTSADIDNVALNDANQVTFGYGTGTAPEGFDGYEQYHWRTWQNGQPGAEQTIDCFVPSEDEFGNAVYDVTGVYYLTGAGQAYGRSYPDSAEIPGYYPTAIYMYCAGSGRFELPNPPFMNRGERTSGVTAISQGGVIAGSGEDSVGFDLEHPENNLCSPGFVCQDGHYTLFDGQGNYSHADFSSGVTLVGVSIDPFLVNDEGWVVGSDEMWNPTKLWDGQSVWTLGASFGVESPSGLNNQGQVVLRSWSSFGWGGSTKEGSLWEHGTRTTLVDHVPAALKGQIANVQPYAISNQAVPGSDATIHLLATATVNGTAGTLVITRDNEGTWSFAQIQPPDGTSVSRYVSINSSGVVASIGNPSTGDKHALLLVPVDIEPDNAYVSGDSGKTATTNGVLSQDISTGANDGKGGMVPSIIRGPVRGQKHFVSPKSTVVDDRIALQSGLPKQMINLFEWAPEPVGSTVAVFSADKLDLLVKRDTAQKTVVKLRYKATQKVVDTMNVWIVWAKGRCEHVASPTWVNGVGDSSDGSHLKAGSFMTATFNDTANYYKFVFDIEPKELTDLTKDIPDLTGNMDQNHKPPGGLHILNNLPLSEGAAYKWDVTRKMQIVIKNPGGILPSKMPAAPGGLYNAQPQVVATAEPWPNDPDDITGNDDSGTTDEENNPYADCTDTGFSKSHSRGSVISLDAPNCVVFDDGHRNDGDIYVEDIRFAEFLRLQIAGRWYHVSDNINWYHIMKTKYVIGTFDRNWTNNGSTGGISN